MNPRVIGADGCTTRSLPTDSGQDRSLSKRLTGPRLNTTHCVTTVTEPSPGRNSFGKLQDFFGAHSAAEKSVGRRLGAVSLDDALFGQPDAVVDDLAVGVEQ